MEDHGLVTTCKYDHIKYVIPNNGDKFCYWRSKIYIIGNEISGKLFSRFYIRKAEITFRPPTVEDLKNLDTSKDIKKARE